MESSTIAVVGSGIAGLTAAWLLARRHRVTLFEADHRLGGHTHTLDVALDGMRAPVDTGFLVFNDRTYPNLIALFDHLGIESAPSTMSFSARIEPDGVEWSGTSLAALFAQKSNLVRPEFWAMLRDVLRFNAEGREIIANRAPESGSLGEFLACRRYGRAFRDWYLLPMAAAIWSCPTQRMLAYPAATFLQFFHNHGLLQIGGRPKWRTVRGGGRTYVERLARDIQEVRLRTPVRSVRRLGDQVEVSSAGRAPERYDQVVLACHTDQSLGLLADADRDEQRILASIRYQSNRVVLHGDRSFLPRARDAWSAWNYFAGPGGTGSRPVSVSYWLNRLQPLPFRTPVIETLNPHREPTEECVLARLEYAHPMFDAAAMRAQTELQLVQGRRRTWFCGAWNGYGFHEDGLRAGLAVANALGVRAPWQTRERLAA